MSPLPACATILLADHTRGEAFREGFRTRGAAGHDDVLLSLLIVVALLAGMWAMSRLVGMRQRRVYNNPWKLFAALCKLHRLNWSERRLLRRVARSHRLRDPGRLFLEGELWEEKRLSRGLTSEFRRLQTLRERILGGSDSAGNRESAKAPPAPAAAAPPLFPGRAKPTLDVPPWTAG